MERTDKLVAYFTMEIALANAMPTYSGGLGVLAGDAVRAAADLGVPMVAVTLLYRAGYFDQQLQPDGTQTERAAAWEPARFLTELPLRVQVEIEGRPVRIRAWQYEVEGSIGTTVPVYFLDADLEENDPRDRELTHTLYGGDARYRLCQEVILGIGGVRMLRALGYATLARFHMNEGHAAFLTLALLEEAAAKANRPQISLDDVEAVRRLCVFTTHTPVPAGHDQFPLDLVQRVLRRPELETMRDVLGGNGMVNMTRVALNLSHYINGVAERHGEVARLMFAAYEIDAITNGVHARTWAAEPFQRLFDRYIPGWQKDSAMLRYALSIPPEELWTAHVAAKRLLIEEVNRRTQAGFFLEVMTLGFARRATPYKRADLLLHDPARLRRLAESVGPLQIVYAGKAHPQDEGGKTLIKRVVQTGRELGGRIRLTYLNNYDMELGKLMTAGVDLWLNTPEPPLEASGTSGMKAALNGVPSLSVLDGWWIEGHLEGVTGWAFGKPAESGTPKDDGRTPEDAAALYEALEQVVMPMFHRDRAKWLDVMRHAIALNGSFFNAQRMMRQYVLRAYLG